MANVSNGIIKRRQRLEYENTDGSTHYVINLAEFFFYFTSYAYLTIIKKKTKSWSSYKTEEISAYQ